jgi:GntR family transcriptional regulator, trigonelline degradation regulator
LTANRLHIAPIHAPLRHQVVELMRAAITDGSFQPGDKLIERELCEATSVSRTSVREALRQLEAEGFVESKPNRGIFVASLTPAEADEIYAVRAVLEGTAGRLFAEQATTAQLRKIERIHEEIEASGKARNAKRMLAAKVKFYELLLEGANNAILRQMLGNLHGRVMLLRSLSLRQEGRLEQTLTEMRAVVAAIKVRDGQAAFDACVAHVASAARVVADALRDGADAPAPRLTAQR